MNFELIFTFFGFMLPLFLLFFFMKSMAYFASIHNIECESKNNHKALILNKKIKEKLLKLKNNFINFALLKH